MMFQSRQELSMVAQLQARIALISLSKETLMDSWLEVLPSSQNSPILWLLATIEKFYI